MKKIIYGAFATLAGLVLLFSYRTSVGEALPTGQSTNTTGTTSTGTSSTGTTSTGTDSSSTASGLTDGTFTGAAANTRYGGVAVRITVSGGMITKVDVPQYPSSNGRDRQINQQAIPILVSETVSAQSSRIDMVSGATYTSDGYLQSLQSAIDQATA
ncbi:FMN-binding protein [Microbacterium sp. P5_E9]